MLTSSPFKLVNPLNIAATNTNKYSLVKYIRNKETKIVLNVISIDNFSFNLFSKMWEKFIIINMMIIEKNPKKRYLANVNPKNKKSVKFFTQNKFKLIQHTYELINSE